MKILVGFRCVGGDLAVTGGKCYMHLNSVLKHCFVSERLANVTVKILWRQ